jgi:hypothetical protein
MCCAAWNASGEELVEVFTGNSNAITDEFEVRAPWIIDWRVTSEYRTGASIEVSLVDAEKGPHIGYVLTTTGTGNGVKLFEEGGRFYLRVNSNLVNWTLKVVQLTEEEAELYTPKQTGD